MLIELSTNLKELPNKTKSIGYENVNLLLAKYKISSPRKFYIKTYRCPFKETRLIYWQYSSGTYVKIEA